MQQQGVVFIYVIMTIMMVHVFGQNLSVTVVPTRTKFNGQQDVEVTLTYKNKGSQKVLVYEWYVPDQKLYDPLFEVTRDGKPVAYVGPLVKRRVPVAADMVSVEPGASISARVPLSSVYNITETGNYVVQFIARIGSMLATSARLLNVDNSSSNIVNDDILVSPSATFFATGRSNALIEEAQKVAAQPRASIYTFSGCSSSQQSTIISAVRAGTNYASSSLQYVSSVNAPGTTRYTTWFGTYSFNNWATVIMHYTLIQKVLSTMWISFDCSCTKANTYAYVYANKPFTIYLCPAFWTAPMNGTDSKGGTLVHETSHFDIVAETTDQAYGQTDCKDLAKSDPAKALYNADSHEYFAENNPALK